MTTPRAPSARVISRRLQRVFAALGLAACSSAPTLDVEISTGQETGALSVDPAVATIEIVASAPGGKVVLHASAKPGAGFDLGEVPDDAPISFELTGKASDDTVIARGRSISIPVGSVSNEQTLPLFIQRLGSFARPKGAIARSHLRAPAAVFQERYLLLTGGESATSIKGSADASIGDFFDLLSFGGADTNGIFGRSAKSLVVRDSSVMAIDDDGASWIDLAAGTQPVEAAAPSGLTFADVSGGQAIDGANGQTWVVGATRSGTPTAAILVVDSAGALSTRALITPRAGAAAAWVPDLGLVVAGGSADGKGVEIVPQGGGATTEVLYDADPTEGAAMVLQASNNVALVGGMKAGAPAPTRVIVPSCPGDCVATPFESATVDNIASRSHAFALTGSILVVGDDSSGETRAFKVIIGSDADGSSTEVPLRERRIGATAIPAPNGTLAILGGDRVDGGPATSVELYFPE